MKTWSEKIKKYNENRSYVDRVIAENKDLIFKVVGKDSTGRDAYYYVRIDPQKKRAFLKNQVGDTYNIEDYGTIIYSAYGDNVPQEVREMLHEKYGFDNWD